MCLTLDALFFWGRGSYLFGEDEVRVLSPNRCGGFSPKIKYSCMPKGMSKNTRKLFKEKTFIHVSKILFSWKQILYNVKLIGFANKIWSKDNGFRIPVLSLSEVINQNFLASRISFQEQQRFIKKSTVWLLDMLTWGKYEEAGRKESK